MLADFNEAAVGAIGAHDALDERAFAGAVFTKQSAKAARLQGDGDIRQGRQGPEDLGKTNRFEPGRRLVRQIAGDGDECFFPHGRADFLDEAHGRTSKRAVDWATAPKTPPCMVTIFRAA